MVIDNKDNIYALTESKVYKVSNYESTILPPLPQSYPYFSNSVLNIDINNNLYINILNSFESNGGVNYAVYKFNTTNNKWIKVTNNVLLDGQIQNSVVDNIGNFYYFLDNGNIYEYYNNLSQIKYLSTEYSNMIFFGVFN